MFYSELKGVNGTKIVVRLAVEPAVTSPIGLEQNTIVFVTMRSIHENTGSFIAKRSIQ